MCIRDRHQIANGVCTVCKAEVETSGVQTLSLIHIYTYLFFTNDVVTRPQAEYPIRVRARWIMIVGDPDGQYMVCLLYTSRCV